MPILEPKDIQNKVEEDLRHEALIKELTDLATKTYGSFEGKLDADISKAFHEMYRALVRVTGRDFFQEVPKIVKVDFTK